MNNLQLKLIYHDKNLFLSVKNDADIMFANANNSCLKSLWIYTQYKNKKGIVSLNGKQPSRSEIGEASVFSDAMKMWLASKAEKWPELFVIDELEISFQEQASDNSELCKFNDICKDQFASCNSPEEFLNKIIYVP